ncbi:MULTISPECIES: transglycosylase domain-containing protein [unclassified Streptomyces]|uniref:transglycosylase domain-containing protein n=1 Tax=unclassified Streptomyces TaxID=2593676 RepID=UPI00224D9A61|nr:MULTISPECIES: transglycosylase domain-containing protein [unclassified Streptomyces]MCX4408378.1 penicillin-binding protein [Streptomyces sp. NBC_01764]MCX5186082.1 penicillin-binding protein [Streptomyces sp. NBC_00268]
MSGHRRRPRQRSVGGTRAGGDRATGRRAAHRDQAGQDLSGRARRRAPQGKRRIDYPRGGRTGPRRWLPSVRQLLALLLLFIGGTAAAVGYAYATVTIPDPNPTALLQNNVYYWSDGTVLATDGSVNRQNVSLSQVPADVQWDFIAAENASFYTDPGIDPQGIARAVVHMAEGGSVQSGSTITQQFVKNTYLDQAQTVSRKFKELLISTKIGAAMTKEQILQGYLNTCFFGRQANGIQAAARMYYNLPVDRLDVSQGAFLAAAVNEPSLFQHADSDPAARAQAEARWSWVLDRMVRTGKLTPGQRARYEAAGFPAPRKWTPGSGLTGETGYLVQLARSYAEAHDRTITDSSLSRGGYQIHTTFDRKRTAALARAVAKVRGQRLDPARRSVDRDVQVGAASVEPTTGRILAVYGGPGFDHAHYSDNADTSGVPVGSTFKPVVLAAALQHGAVLRPGESPEPITPASKFNGDDGIEIKDRQGNRVADPKDPTGLLHQHNDTPRRWGYIPLRKAMEQSVNTPYVQLGEDVGYGNVARTAETLGLRPSSLAAPSAGFYIGTSTPSAIRMAGVYATLAAEGMQTSPYSVTKVTHNGSVLSGFTAPATVRALPAAVAGNVTDVLRGVIARGTGTKAQALGRTAAGKTGTTDDYRSAWFIGYTPQLATSVVLFREDSNHPQLQSLAGVGGLQKVFGGDIPTEIWTQYMRDALAGLPDASFPVPASLGRGTDEPGAPTPSPSAAPAKRSGKTGKRAAATVAPTPDAPAKRPKCRHHKCG